MSIKITEKAMLVTLKIGQYTGKKQDKKAEQTIDNTFQTHDAGTYRKFVIGKGHLDEITKLTNEIRTYHYTNTLPWTDEGKRLLPCDNYQAYTDQIRRYKTLFNEKADSFKAIYPDLIKEAQSKLNGLFNPQDYADPNTIREKFYMELTFDPIPEEGDIRVNIQQDELDQLNKDLETRKNNAIAQAMKDLYLRLHDCIKHAQERLSDPKAIFRDSLIDNIIDLVKILPALNVTNDPTLDKLREEVSEKLTKYQPDTLREYPTARQETANNASEILKKMEGLY
jgi:hypothetical protein